MYIFNLQYFNILLLAYIWKFGVSKMHFFFSLIQDALHLSKMTVYIVKKNVYFR